MIVSLTIAVFEEHFQSKMKQLYGRENTMARLGFLSVFLLIDRSSDDILSLSEFTQFVAESRWVLLILSPSLFLSLFLSLSLSLSLSPSLSLSLSGLIYLS